MIKLLKSSGQKGKVSITTNGKQLRLGGIYDPKDDDDAVNYSFLVRYVDEHGGGGGGSFATITGDPYDNTLLAAALNSKQDELNYIPEDETNKVDNLDSPDDETYPTTKAVNDAIQAQLSSTTTSRSGIFANKRVVAFGSRGPFATQLSNGTDTTETSRYGARTVGNVSDVQIYFLYSNDINALTLPTVDDVTIEASIEYPAGTFTRLTFNGSNTKTLKFGFGVLTDLVKVNIPANTNFWIRTNVLVNSGQVWLKNRATSTNIVGGLAEGVAVGVNSVMSGTIANSGSYGFGPSLILGVSDTDRGSILIFGDSIMCGSGDIGQPGIGFQESGGYYGRAFSNSWPVMRCQIGGQRLSHWRRTSPPAIYYDEILSCAQFGLSNLGINDVGLGDSLATMQANALNIWYSQKARGVKMYHCTLTPKTTSTDGWTTTTNQTVTANEPVRLGFNNWIRDGAPLDSTTKTGVPAGTTGPNIIRSGNPYHPLVGYFETADLAETSRNSGIWKANRTADGTHPNTASYAELVTAIDTTKFLL